MNRTHAEVKADKREDAWNDFHEKITWWAEAMRLPQHEADRWRELANEIVHHVQRLHDIDAL